MSWKIDPAHSQVTFSIRHMMISNVRGRFENFTGEVNFNEQEPEESTVNVQIEAASINTREPMRDGHLKSPDFLDAEKYPTLTYVSKSVEKVDASHGRIHGELTIKGVTRPVDLEVEYAGQQSIWGKTNAGFSAKAKISRKEWGLGWNQVLESGGLLVGDEISVEIELEVVRQPDAVKEAESAG
jgi:polyisoprenoid-binding protein YceI